MLDGQGYDISCDLVMKVSVGGQVRSIRVNVPVPLLVPVLLTLKLSYLT